jgi:hypothetical protein
VITDRGLGHAQRKCPTVLRRQSQEITTVKTVAQVHLRIRMWNDRGKQKYSKSDRQTDCLTNRISTKIPKEIESRNWAMDEVHIHKIVGFYV